MVTLSEQAISGEDFLDFIVDTLDHSSVSPSMSCSELTGTVISTVLQHASRFIEVLHRIGYEFALDDFGSRFGAFSNLKVQGPVGQLPGNRGQCYGSLATDNIRQDVARAMIRLARTVASG